MTGSAVTGKPPGSPAGSGRRRRIHGVDLARALAIVGMLAVHVGPTDDTSLPGRLYAAPYGRASVLFVLVAGVGVSLLAGSRSASPARTRLTLLWRSLLLLPVGLALQLLDHGAFVILQEYAVLFVLAAVVVGLGDRWLLGLAAASAVLGPVTYVWGNLTAPRLFDRDAVTLTDPLTEIVHALVLSGPYPLVVWAAPFLLGMWLGRRDLRSQGVRLWLVLAGGATALLALALSAGLVAVLGEPGDAVGWDHLTAHVAHSQMPLWLASATGSAALVLGAALAAADTAGRRAWPLVATGQLALTVYVGHLLALHAAPDALTSDAIGGAALRVVAFVVVAMLAASAWRSVYARGPLEILLRPPWQPPLARSAP